MLLSKTDLYYAYTIWKLCAAKPQPRTIIRVMSEMVVKENDRMLKRALKMTPNFLTFSCHLFLHRVSDR